MIDPTIKSGDEVTNPEFVGVDGMVIVDMEKSTGLYMRMTSDHARVFARKLIVAAEQADGNPITHLSIMPLNDGTRKQ